MASQSQGIQQLLAAEKKAAELVSEARKRKHKVVFVRILWLFWVGLKSDGIDGLDYPVTCCFVFINIFVQDLKHFETSVALSTKFIIAVTLSLALAFSHIIRRNS